MIASVDYHHRVPPECDQMLLARIMRPLTGAPRADRIELSLAFAQPLRYLEHLTEMITSNAECEICAQQLPIEETQRVCSVNICDRCFARPEDRLNLLERFGRLKFRWSARGWDEQGTGLYTKQAKHSFVVVEGSVDADSGVETIARKSSDFEGSPSSIERLPWIIELLLSGAVLFAQLARFSGVERKSDEE